MQLKDSSHHLAFSLLQEVEASHHQDLVEGDRSRHWGINLMTDLYWPKRYDADHHGSDWYSPKGQGHNQSCICKRRVSLLDVQSVPSIYHKIDGMIVIVLAIELSVCNRLLELDPMIDM